MPKRTKRKMSSATTPQKKRRRRLQRARVPMSTPGSTSPNKLRSRRDTPQENIIRNLEKRQRVALKSTQGQQRAKGYAPPAPAGPNEPLNDTALAILEGLGCTILSQEIYTKDHSLISDQTDTEMIENTNIIDHKLFDKLSPAAMNAGKNFKNFNDPIFKLDQPLPRAQTKMRDKAKKRLTTPNIEMITADLINLNTKVKGGGKLKNFK